MKVFWTDLEFSLSNTDMQALLKVPVFLANYEFPATPSRSSMSRIIRLRPSENLNLGTYLGTNTTCSGSKVQVPVRFRVKVDNFGKITLLPILFLSLTYLVNIYVASPII